MTTTVKSIFALNPEEHLVAKHLKSAGADLRSVWGGTLYMPEDQVFQSHEFPSFAKLFQSERPVYVDLTQLRPEKLLN